MRLPRFTTRRLMVMVVVAVAITILAVLASFRRRARFQAIRDYHASRFASKSKATDRGVTYTNENGAVIYQYGPSGPTEEQTRLHVADQKWHRAMHDKYERAARYPWLPVAPDPAGPK